MTPSAKETLVTPRLLLLPWEADDWQALMPIATDVEVMRYITGGIPWTEAEVRAFVERQRAAFAQSGFCRWQLIDRQSGEMAGFCGIGIMELPEFTGYEIGWWLKRSHWGRGLATEAGRVALDDGLRRQLDPIISIAVPDNLASLRIMQKLGLRRYGCTVRKGFTVEVYMHPSSHLGRGQEEGAPD